jgi:phosphoglycolate phosphatase
MTIHPKLVIFDWDNTLAITRPAVVESMNYVLNKYGLEPWDIIKGKHRDNTKSLKDNFPNFFKNNYLEAYDDYINYYLRKGIKSLTPVQNADKLIKKLQSSDIRVVILSNKDHKLLDKEVNICFPDIRFDGLFGYNDFYENKPSPLPIIEICKESLIDRTPENAWLIGDSSQDINCAIAAGIRGILIGDGNLMNKEDPQKLKTHNILRTNSMQEIMEVLSV